MPLESARTLADGLVVSDGAVGAHAAGAFAGVGAAQLVAGLVRRALGWAGALRVTASQSAPLVVLRTLADGPVVDRFAAGARAARVRARVTTPVLSVTEGANVRAAVEELTSTVRFSR